VSLLSISPVPSAAASMPLSAAAALPMSDLETQTLTTALDALGLRQRVIANNIANVNTPGFTAGQVDFESALARAVASGDPTAALIQASPSTAPAGPDGNNVDLPGDTLTLTQSNLQYQTLIEGLNAKFQMLRTAMQEN
jgi:flagellar basal-body rod protein FlgB